MSLATHEPKAVMTNFVLCRVLWYFLQKVHIARLQKEFKIIALYCRKKEGHRDMCPACLELLEDAIKHLIRK